MLEFGDREKREYVETEDEKFSRHEEHLDYVYAGKDAGFSQASEQDNAEEARVVSPIRRRSQRIRKQKIKARISPLKEWVVYCAVAFAIAFIIMQFIKPTIVKQNSMEPNFHTNDYLFISKQSYHLFGGNPEIGDVIVFRSKLKDGKGKEKLLIKRVIGVPGDTITIKDGKVFVNGEEIDATYTMTGSTNGYIEDLVVTKDSLFCLGDNREVSVDSRYEEVGLIPEDDVLGKAVFRLFPIKEAGRIKNPYDK
jgi:signal peptidase I